MLYSHTYDVLAKCGLSSTQRSIRCILVETPCSSKTWRESARISCLSFSLCIDRSFIRFPFFLSFSSCSDRREKGKLVPATQRVAIGFRVFRQTSGPLLSKKTEERRNRSASNPEVEVERGKNQGEGKNRKRMKKKGKRREIVIFKIDPWQRRVERASRGRFREGWLCDENDIESYVITQHAGYILDVWILFEEQSKPSTNIKTRWQSERRSKRRRSRANSNNSNWTANREWENN